MNKQKLIFFLVVGLSIIIVSVASILNSGLLPAKPAATATESVIKETATSEELVPGVLSGKQTWDGLKIEITEVIEDGWPLVEAQNQFNDPPLSGKQMLLITVQVQMVEGDEPVSISMSDFKVVGDLGE